MSTGELRLASPLSPVGLATMNLVDATSRVTCARDAGWSKACTAGVIPKSSRIQAACRASTEWMPTAAASTAFDFSLRRLPLVGGDGEIFERDRGLQERLAAARSFPGSRTAAASPPAARAAFGTLSRAPARSRPTTRRCLRRLPRQRAASLRLGVEGRLQILEHERVVQDARCRRPTGRSCSRCATSRDQAEASAAPASDSAEKTSPWRALSPRSPVSRRARRRGRLRSGTDRSRGVHGYAFTPISCRP